MVNNHHEINEKKGNGIKEFKIQKNKWNKNAYELYIIRNDNTKIDISWIKCCKKNANVCDDTNKKKKLISAMRYSIEEQIWAFKTKHINDNCCICDKKIMNKEEIDIDHIITFKNLSGVFLQKYQGDIPKYFNDETDGCNRATFKKENYVFEKKWQIYHEENATLQVTHFTCNRSKKIT